MPTFTENLKDAIDIEDSITVQPTLHVTILKVATLGTPFTQDPSVSLINYIKNNWDTPTTFVIPKSRCYFDNKWGRSDIPNEIVVERVATNDVITALGMQRIRNYDSFTIQLVARGDNAINNLFLMQQHIEDLINGNPTAERVDGFDEFKITGWQPVKTWSDDDISASVVDTLNTNMARSKALVTVIYDKYPAST